MQLACTRALFFVPKMKKSNDLYIENDKYNAPLLLAASFQGLIKFLGSYSENGVLYWQFSPKEKALGILEQYQTKTEPHIPAKDLFEAISTFWKSVSRMRNGEMRDGRVRL